MSVIKKDKPDRQPQPISIEDPAVTSAFGKRPDDNFYARVERLKRMTPAQRRKMEQDRSRKKATYDLPQWVLEAIEMIAETYQVPKSNIVAHLIANGLRNFLAGQFSIEWSIGRRSRSPRFESIMNPPAEIDLAELKKALKEKKW